MRTVTSYPDFPANKLNLARGNILKAVDECVAQIGLRVGDRIPIGYDGEYVRSGPFTWSIDQMVEEIGAGVWQIDGAIDLSDSARKKLFAEKIEGLQFAN